MATPAALHDYREAIEALFALAIEGPEAKPRACEKALRRETVAGISLTAAERAQIIRAATADYIESNDSCPLCGGPPHESEP